MNRVLWLSALLVLAALDPVRAAGGGGAAFPPPLDTYQDSHLQSIGEIVAHRIAAEPFNLAATLIFLFAIIHTFLTSRFMEVSHRWEHEHEEQIASGQKPRGSVHFGAGIFHFLGEVEAVFGIWVIALVGAIVGFRDWNPAIHYSEKRTARVWGYDSSI